MNRKILFIILTAFILFVPFLKVQAVILTPDNPFKRFRVEISFIEPTNIFITHSNIDRVSVNMRTLVAVGTVVLENNAALKSASDAIYLEYFTDTSTTTVKVPVSFVQTSTNTYSFVTSPVVVSNTNNTVYYKIVAEDSNGKFGYYPDSSTYITAGLYPTEQKSIGTDGGTLLLQSGDQTRGDSSITFLGSALLTEQDFLMQELYPTDPLPSVDNLNPIITYYLSPQNFTVTTRALMPSITLYYGDMPPNNNNIDVKWFNGSSWQSVSFANDTEKRTVTVNLSQTNTEFGYYAIFEKVKLTDNDYRPVERAFMPGEKIIFRNLKTGDSVTIFNLKGQPIKTLATAPFEWDGRTTSGGYAESGSYIYQIKVEGRVVSGSLAFVR